MSPDDFLAFLDLRRFREDRFLFPFRDDVSLEESEDELESPSELDEELEEDANAERSEVEESKRFPEDPDPSESAPSRSPGGESSRSEMSPIPRGRGGG